MSPQGQEHPPVDLDTSAHQGEERDDGTGRPWLHRVLPAVNRVVEDVLLGVIDADDVPGAVKSSEIQAPRAMRWFGRGLRRPPQ